MNKYGLLNKFPSGLSFMSTVISPAADEADTTSFKITIDTENAGSATKTFNLPSVGGPFDVTDWGDGQSDLGVSGAQSHVYGATGIYTITINKIENAFQPCKFNNTGDKAKLLSVLQWGNIVWDDCNSSFLDVPIWTFLPQMFQILQMPLTLRMHGTDALDLHHSRY